MPSQLIVGKELRRIGKAVLELKNSRRLSEVGSSGVTRPSLFALALFCALPVAATAALYLSVPNETLNANPVRRPAVETVRLPDLRDQMAATLEVVDEPLTHDIFVREAETLASLFARLGVRDPQAQTFILHTPEAQALLAPQAGQFISAVVDEKGLISTLSLYMDSNVTGQGRVLTVARQDGALAAELADYSYDVELIMVNGLVSDSIEESLQQSRVPSSIVAQMHSAFDYDRDVVNKMKKGDAFRLIYESKFADGNFVRYGRLLAMQLDQGGQTTELFWFGNDDAGGNYYDASGRISRRTFLRVPLDVQSVSSEFSPMRRHPVTGVLRPHYGTDFRAPWGAIVRAAADGVVQFAGVGTGFGNYIRLAHGPDVVTLYAHLSSIDPKVKRGAAVKYGDVIGRVGQTGLATGPHLHYELKIDGVQINPMTARLPDTLTLSPYRYAQMEVLIAPLRAKLELLHKVQTAGLSAAEAPNAHN